MGAATLRCRGLSSAAVTLFITSLRQYPGWGSVLCVRSAATTTIMVPSTEGKAGMQSGTFNKQARLRNASKGCQSNTHCAKGSVALVHAASGAPAAELSTPKTRHCASSN